MYTGRNYNDELDFFSVGRIGEREYKLINGELMYILKVEERTKEYSAVQYMNLLLQQYYINIDLQPDIKEKLDWAFDAKRKLIDEIGVFNEHLFYKTKNERIERDYKSDFEQLLKQADSTIEKFKVKLDAIKYELEVKKLEKEVYWWKDPRFYFGYFLGLITLIVSILPYLIKYIAESNK